MTAVSIREANGGMSADRWIRSTTTVAVAMLALIAGVMSFGHMHELASSPSLLVTPAQAAAVALPWTLLILGR